MEQARCGNGAAVLIEGAAGIGKTCLLEAVTQRAAAAGVSVAMSAMSEFGPLAPLAPLVDALETLGRAARKPGFTRQLRPPPGLVDDIADRLAEHAQTVPTLVILDDLQWADPMMLAALQVLTRRLKLDPIEWLLARRPREADAYVGQLFRELERDMAAVRVELEPLDHECVSQIVRDVIGVDPGPELAALTTRSGGNPGLLIDLLLGLRAEGSIEKADGQGFMRSVRLPDRLQRAVLARLGKHTTLARDLVDVAAVLGSSFEIGDVADVMRLSVAQLLPSLRELLDADLLVIAGDRCSFASELLWQTIVETVPDPVRQALHLQIAETLLARGDAVSASAHLTHSPRRGNDRILGALDQAAVRLLTSAPDAAAEIAMRALELIGPADPALAARTEVCIAALVGAGRLAEAGALVTKSLARPQPPSAQAALHCALSVIWYLRGKSLEAKTEADMVLARAGLPASEYAAASLAALQSMSEPANAPPICRSPAEIAATGWYDEVTRQELAALALAAYYDGRFSDAVRLAEGVLAQSHEQFPMDLEQRVAWHCARFHCVDLVVRLGDIRDALTRITGAYADSEMDGHAVETASAAILLARTHLLAGRFDQAIEEAHRSLQSGRELSRGMFGPLALAILARARLRQGDLASAATAVDQALVHLLDVPTPTALRIALAAAEVAEVREGGARAVALLAAAYDGPEICRRLLIEEPTSAGWMVRVALGAGDVRRAQRVSAVADQLAADNPGFAVIEAPAAHARALLGSDVSALRRASAQLLWDPWVRASAAEDVGVLSAKVLEREGNKTAVASFEAALIGYESTGATRDAARLRSRLRDLGVRRRHWKRVGGPTSGWASLTDTELVVANLVSEGLTNRLIAERMFLSVHTIAFHLRHIYAKLRISSRVDLARLRTEQQRTLLGNKTSASAAS